MSVDLLVSLFHGEFISWYRLIGLLVKWLAGLLVGCLTDCKLLSHSVLILIQQKKEKVFGEF